MGLEFAASKSALASELNSLLSVLPKKSVIPILDCIRIQSDGQALKLTTTNMESTINSRFEGKLVAVTQEGTLCMPAKRLAEIVRLASEGPIKITADDNNWVHIIAKGSRYKVPGFDSSAWPDLPKSDTVSWIEIPVELLKLMLPSVKYAISGEESRANLRGAQLEIDENGLRMVATDGSRMALASAALESLPLSTFQVFIPLDGVEELARLVGDTTGVMGIGLNQSGSLFFKGGSKVVSTRLLTAKFPNYQLPFSLLNTYETFGTLKADEFSQSIKRAMLCAEKKEDKKYTSVSLSFEPSQIKINCISQEGESNEVVPCTFTGLVKIFCNGKFLTDCLDPLGSTEIRVEVKDTNQQVFITGSKGKVACFALVMPMKG